MPRLFPCISITSGAVFTHLVSVTSVADEKKGERLVVLHAIDLDVESVCESLARKGIPNLWIPKKDSFYRVNSIPILGTGKMDLKRVKSLALHLTGASDA